MKAWLSRWRVGIAAFVGLVLGALVRGFFPPFVLDDPFWREFLSGPPVAGMFAVIGAAIAYGAASVGARTSRRGAERQEWWDRAEWALNLARSNDHVDRLIGLRALDALRDEATQSEYVLILAVTEGVTGGMDTADTVVENGNREGGDHGGLERRERPR